MTMFSANIDTASLVNASARSAWVEKQLKTVKDNFLDGVNVDFESAISKDHTDVRDGLTMLMKELTQRFKEESKNYMVRSSYNQLMIMKYKILSAFCIFQHC